MKLRTPLALLLAGASGASGASGAAPSRLGTAQAQGILQGTPPAESAMARAAAAQGLQQVLVSPLEDATGIAKAGWMLGQMDARPAPASVLPKMGQRAVALSGEAEAPGAKGDFGLAGAVPGEAKYLGLWVHLAPGANVERVGFQVQDAEGESLLATVPADWQGWKWVEVDWAGASVAQAYEQKDKNKRADSPLQGVNVAWFAKLKGPTSLSIDALAAATALKGAPATLDVQAAGATVGEPNAPISTQQIVLTNFAAQPLAAKVEFTIQRDPSLFSAPIPDPIYGADIALGAKSWSEAEGKRLEDGSLTDGRDWTSASLPWGKHTQATQTIDLGAERQITRLAYTPGDANWAWKVDVSASPDGKDFSPVAGLQNVDAHGKWGAQVLEAAPFRARFLRLRHHNGGAEVNQISMPSSLSVFGGAAGQRWELPRVGEVIAQGTLEQKIAPRSFGAVDIKSDTPLAAGAYLIAATVQEGGATQVVQRHFFVMPARLASVEDSRFGLNTSDYELAAQHRRLGIGWVRFENMKWPMISPAPGVFRFDGTVAPWNVPHDRIVSAYRAQGIQFLPFLFQTPGYATSAPESAKARGDSYPPRDNAQMADFVFQTVARYGSKKQPPQVLATPDKKSGLGQISTFEIWNEPNLTDPGWGPWVGTAEQYNAMLRAASEGAKRADPKALVTNGGTAGIDVETVGTLLRPYADGKKPLDFVDVLNVHFYSGRVAPELSTSDPNADRSGNSGNSGNLSGARTYEEDLQRLVQWRDRHKPGLPIWMTETGYDSAGPFGTNEQFQAARLPRVIMVALAAGIDKVFVYREAGSTASMHAASGLLRNDGSLKPSWFTYATLIRQLDGIQKGGLRLPTADPNVRLYAFTRAAKPGAPAETILAAWTIEGTGALGLKLGQSTVTDAFGSTRQQDIAGNLPLSMFPTYITKIGDAKALQVLVGAARQQQAARKAEQARLSKLRAYLFDFGSTENVGTLDIGDTRTFTPVLGGDIFSEAKGFGFFPAAAGQDNSMHWISDALEKDSVRMNPDHAFRLSAKPGRYTLRAKVTPQGDANFVIKGAVGGEKSFPIKRDGPIVEAEIEVAGEPISVSNSGYGDMFWLTLVEEAEKAR